MERELLALVWPVFSEECREHLEALGSGLLGLERASGEDLGNLLRSLKRTAHTLKGSASSVGLDEVEHLAHDLEDLLGDASRPFTRERVNAALAVVARMDTALDGARQQVEGPAAMAPPPPGSPVPTAPAEVAPPPAAALPPAAIGGSDGAAPEPPDREPGPGPAASRERTVRVSVGVLDALLDQVEGLSLAANHQEVRARAVHQLLDRGHGVIRSLQRLASQERIRPGGDATALDGTVAELRGLYRELARLGQETRVDMERLRLVGQRLRDDLRDLRAAPVSTVLDPLRHVAREIASRLGKEVQLTIEGGEVRLDRRILDEMRDPLLHLLRNAIDHGVEPPEVRRAAGKPVHGRLHISVVAADRRVRLTVADDGPGLDLERIRTVAVHRGILSAAEARLLDDEQAARLVFRSGFTTAEQVNEVSGRGVGLDVVQAVATRLQGAVDLEPAPGGGTRVVLDLPLTLAATLGVLVRAGGEVLAVPSDGVERLVRVRPEGLATVAGRTTVAVGEDRLPYCVLARVLGISRGQLPPAGKKPLPALVLAHGPTRIVAAVDEVLGQEELVLQPLGDAVAQLPHLAGAAMREGRRLVPVLAVPELVRTARPPNGTAAGAEKRRILCVDDSLTTRAAMKAVLELAGFEVIAAGDGAEALEILAQTAVALVVTDVQMPRVDGFELIRRIRADGRLSSLPTILVTSLESADDKAAGMEAGADAYLVKREVERGRLLELVEQLLPAVA
jgi:two-component system chemotaxis sensor kinase CheA